MVNKNSKGFGPAFRRFGGWLLGVIGAVIVALAIAWAKFLVPTPSVPDDTDHFDIAGIAVECNIPISPMLGDRIMRQLTQAEAHKGASYMLINGLLLQAVLSSGDSLYRYHCTFSDPRFYVEYFAQGRPRTSDGGQQCRQVRVAQSHFPQGEGILFVEDEVFFALIDACRQEGGHWKNVQVQSKGRGPR